MDQHYGAAPSDWLHLNNVLDVGVDLLPVVSNPTARISETSKMKQLGKTPSQYAQDGTVVGIRDWTMHYSSDQQIQPWSQNPDLGICVQTRATKALDIDVADQALVDELLEAVRLELGIELPRRARENSPKCLLAFRIDADTTYAKRIMKTRAGNIEFLANGQQYIAIGTHPSGARYQWPGGLPSEIPAISPEQFEQLWQHLAKLFAIEPPVEMNGSDRKIGDDLELPDPVADYLEAKGMVLETHRDGTLYIECPWQDDHTSGNPGDGSTVWFRAGSRGHSNGHFKCLHSHCGHRSDQAFFDAIGYQEDVAALFPDLSVPFDHAEAAATETAIPRFFIESAEDFANRPSPGWIVKGLIPRAGLGIVYGESGSGKSFFILDLIAAICRGVDWRGHRVTKSRCVYIAAEGAGGFRNRIKAYKAHHQARLDDLKMLAAAPNFLLADDIKDLTKAVIQAGGADVIVVDTYAQVTPGANENTSEDMGKALRHCALLHKATGALVILVHHAGKDTSRGARGWSGNRAAADFEIEVLITDDGRMARVRKQKDGRDDAAWGFALEDVNIGIDEDGDVITSCVVVDAPIPDNVPSRRGGSPRARGQAAPAKQLGRWEQAIVDAYNELTLSGGDVTRTDLINAAADKHSDAGSVKARRAATRRALGTMSKGKGATFSVEDENVYNVE